MGFTLSELLVSLSVLGLIAALTLPTVFNSVKVSRERAVYRETIQTLQAVFKEGVDNGEIYNAATMATYLRDHMNYAQYQNTACMDARNYSGSANQYCFRMHSGAVVNIAAQYDFLYITPSIPMEAGRSMSLNFNWSQTQGFQNSPSGARNNQWAPRPGEMLPSWNADIAIYKEVFGLD